MEDLIRIFLPTEIPELDKEINSNTIREKLKNHVDELLKNVNMDELNGWKIAISIICQASDGIGVAKRLARYPSDQEFGVYISVAIPSDEQAPYGYVRVKGSFFKPINDKYSYRFSSNFDFYENLDEYIFESGKMAINFVFKNGFTCNGKKIQFKNST